MDQSNWHSTARTMLESGSFLASASLRNRLKLRAAGEAELEFTTLPDQCKSLIALNGETTLAFNRRCGKSARLGVRMKSALPCSAQGRTDGRWDRVRFQLWSAP